MSINPLTTAHCDKNEHSQMRPVLTTAIAVCSVEKTHGESNRAAQDMHQGKINHEHIRTSRLHQNLIHKPMVYGEQCTTSALPTDQIVSLFLIK